MGFETITVKTRDEHCFDAQLHLAAKADAPLLFFIPAPGTHKGFYSEFGASMADAGVHFFVVDLRGVGSSSVNVAAGDNFGYREILEEDLPWALIAVRERLKDAASIWMGGHSLGGQLAALFAARAPNGIAGLVLITSGNIHFRGWPGVSSVTVAGRLLGRKPAPEVAEARQFTEDWSSVVRSGRYRVAGAVFDYERALPRLKKPVLSLAFAEDKLAPAAATQHLLDHLPACEKTLWRWSSNEMGGVPLDHFSWALDPARVVPDVAGWVLTQAQKLP